MRISWQCSLIQTRLVHNDLFARSSEVALKKIDTIEKEMCNRFLESGRVLPRIVPKIGPTNRHIQCTFSCRQSATIYICVHIKYSERSCDSLFSSTYRFYVNHIQTCIHLSHSPERALSSGECILPLRNSAAPSRFMHFVNRAFYKSMFAIIFAIFPLSFGLVF